MEIQSGVSRLINMFIDDMYELRGVISRQNEEIKKLKERNRELEEKINNAVEEKLKEARKIGR